MFLLLRKTPLIDVRVSECIYIWLDAVKWMEHWHSGTHLSVHVCRSRSWGKARPNKYKLLWTWRVENGDKMGNLWTDLWVYIYVYIYIYILAYLSAWTHLLLFQLSQIFSNRFDPFLSCNSCNMMYCDPLHMLIYSWVSLAVCFSGVVLC